MEYPLFAMYTLFVLLYRPTLTRSATEPPDISLDWIEAPPEGYYAFIESPNAEPPKVRKPPYTQVDTECPGSKKGGKIHPSNQRAFSLCGDLNKGYIPRNPMKQNVLGSSYPFELIKNKTLQFFSRTLPILKADETLPKVAKYKYYPEDENIISDRGDRRKREAVEELSGVNPPETTSDDVKEREVSQSNNNVTNTSGRTARKFCDTNDGMLCVLYKALQGDSILSTLAGSLGGLNGGFSERRDEMDLPEYRHGETSVPSASSNTVREPAPPALPPTPCPAKVEYATPVFARNYQGVWRYVVQIPYEGYFTQTIEVTRCLNSRCHYMEGGCMSSPRWTSILVAEIFYPDSFLPSRPKSGSTADPSQRQSASGDDPPAVHDFQNYQQYLEKRAGTSAEDADTSRADKKASHCDGVDEIGCFQVRLYYDWFLVPGSCKCWRPDYFSRYMRRKTSPEL